MVNGDYNFSIFPETSADERSVWSGMEIDGGDGENIGKYDGGDRGWW
jgi:hypothetical protein